MPLTPFQSEVLRVIAANRRMESHIAGGIALNVEPTSPRLSNDIDIFHDEIAAVAIASEADCFSLTAAGFSVERLVWQDTFRRASVERNGGEVKIDWAHDSAWRFFPVEADPILVWRLHRFDALANKTLAMSARNETRDLVDLVSNQEVMPLHAVVWGACSKDPGFTPMLLLELMRRNAKIDPDALVDMCVAMTPVELKLKWLKLAEETEIELTRAAKAGAEIGVVFLAPDGAVTWFDTPKATIHRATLGGVIPRIGGVRYEL